MSKLEQELKEMKKALEWIKSGLKKVATLGVSTDTNCGQLVAAKGVILFLNVSAKNGAHARGKKYKEASQAAKEK